MIYSFVLRGINALIKSRPMILRSVWRRKEGGNAAATPKGPGTGAKRKAKVWRSEEVLRSGNKLIS